MGHEASRMPLVRAAMGLQLLPPGPGRVGVEVVASRGGGASSGIEVVACWRTLP